MKSLFTSHLPTLRTIYGLYWMMIAGISTVSLALFWDHYPLWWAVFASAVFVFFGVYGAYIHLIKARREPLLVDKINTSKLNLVTQIHLIYSNVLFLVSKDNLNELRLLFLFGATVSLLFLIGVWIGQWRNKSGAVCLEKQHP